MEMAQLIPMDAPMSLIGPHQLLPLDLDLGAAHGQPIAARLERQIALGPIRSTRHETRRTEVVEPEPPLR
jgi:hypothetical protein